MLHSSSFWRHNTLERDIKNVRRRLFRTRLDHRGEVLLKATRMTLLHVRYRFYLLAATCRVCCCYQVGLLLAFPADGYKYRNDEADNNKYIDTAVLVFAHRAVYFYYRCITAINDTGNAIAF